MKVVLLPLLCLDTPACKIPQPTILNVVHEVLPDRDTKRMVGAIREGCASADDNFCTAADGLIHSEPRIHFAILRQKLLPKSPGGRCTVVLISNPRNNAFSLAY